MLSPFLMMATTYRIKFTHDQKDWTQSLFLVLLHSYYSLLSLITFLFHRYIKTHLCHWDSAFSGPSVSNALQFLIYSLYWQLSSKVLVLEKLSLTLSSKTAHLSSKHSLTKDPLFFMFLRLSTEIISFIF